MKDTNSFLRIPLRAANVTVCHAIVLLLLASMLGFKVPLLMYVLLFFAALACSVVADCLKPGAKTVVSVAVTLILILIAIVFFNKTREGAFWFGRRFVELINQYYGEVLNWTGEAGTESGMLFVLANINIFGCMILTRVYRTGRAFLLWLAPAFLPLYVAVIANIFPAPGKMLAFALMLVFLKITVSWERMPDGRVFQYELLLGGFLVLTALGLPFIITKEQFEDSVANGEIRQEVRSLNEKTVNRISHYISGKWKKDTKQTGGMSGGELSSDGVTFTHQTHLVVSLPKNSPQTYLRGYVGGSYFAGAWAEVQGQDRFVSYARRLLGRAPALENYGDSLTNTNLLLQYLFDKKVLTRRMRFPVYSGEIDIRRRGADENYVYTPYGAIFEGYIGKDNSLVKDGFFHPDGERGYTKTDQADYVFSTVYNRNGYPSIFAYSNNEFASKDDFMFSDLEEPVYGYPLDGIFGFYREYQEYARSMYSTVNPEIWAVLSDAVVRCRETTLFGKVEYVRRYLSENYTYSTDPPKNEEDIDPLLFFIRDSKTGYCMHFASTGVMMLRMLGIPARFAEGYVVTASDIRSAEVSWTDDVLVRDEKGVSRETEEYVTVAVKDDCAHAWAEILIPGYGWYPIEMTTPYSTIDTGYLENALQKEQTVTPSPEITGPVEPGTTVTPTPKPDKTKPTATPVPKTAKTDDGKGHSGAKLALMILLLVVFVVLLLIFGRYAVLMTARNSRLLTRRPNKSALAVYREILVLAGYMGIRRKEGELDREFHKRLFEVLPDYSGEMPIRDVAAVTERAAFSKEGITEDEAKGIRRYYMRLRKDFLQKKNGFSRFFFRLKSGI
ncbi:MAG: transglutaminase domain-containing protein [Lachnospiraceae bacterium]|nr:transglutaminase domain-containing protein [Lachnospiraceae bacterium]